jgi:hypothetical protein
VRFYKGTANTGTHVGNLWSSSGQLLASVTFTNESASGWQQASFSSPVSIQANTTYVVSYFAPNGRYAVTGQAFATSGVDNVPLHALSSGSSGGNGVYRYGTSSGFPTSMFANTNYWVDVVLATTPAGPDTTPPTVSVTTPANGATGVPDSVLPAATFSEPVQAGSIAFSLSGPGGAVAGSTSYAAGSNTATFTPTAPLAASATYTATVSGAQDVAGNPMTAPATWSFTTGAGPACPCSIWSAGATPALASVSDTEAVELGVKFRSDVAGQVTGVRFYKGTGNTGTHVGNLWSATGQLLATVTFSGESATGWQQASFSAPVPIQANTTYVVSYFAPNGRYAVTGQAFATSGVDNAPLHALSSGSSGGNGVYRYGTSSGFPTSMFANTNYWVDVVFSA